MTDTGLTRHRIGPICEKIIRRHQERLAIVYVRQSALQQVERHQESTRLQYALMDRAARFGWMKTQIVVIDDDLGSSCATTEGRLGFQRLVAEVGLGHVGLVLGGRDVSAGALIPRLASDVGDLRALRHADRRRRWVYDPGYGSRRSGDRRDRRRSSCGKHGAEPWSLLRLRDPGCMQIGVEIVVAAHLVAPFSCSRTHHRSPWPKQFSTCIATAALKCAKE